MRNMTPWRPAPKVRKSPGCVPFDTDAGCRVRRDVCRDRSACKTAQDEIGDPVDERIVDQRT
jgi:hypothetical protein